MKKQTKLTGLIGIVFMAMFVKAEVLLYESFDYGDSMADMDQLTNWTDNSSYTRYTPDMNLNNVNVNSTSGGSFLEDYSSPGNREATLDINDYYFSNLSAGDEMWFSFLLKFNNSDFMRVFFDSDGANPNVGDLEFGIDDLDSSSGGLNLYARYVYSSQLETMDTGVEVTADGSTYLFLIKCTKGSGSGIYAPTNSKLEIWFNPGNTASLGDSDWSVSNCKWGRDTSYMKSITIDSGYGNYIDEIRIGTTFEDLKLKGSSGGTIVFLK